jgi:methylglutaconyl-CoA hydratase
MAYDNLHLDISGEIATITFNRPEKRNAISTKMLEEILAALNKIEVSAARVVILTGAGKAFCSGMDLEALKALAAQSPIQHLEDARRSAEFFRRLWSFPKTTIAAVNGAAIAGGCSIATFCDLTVSVPEAKFGYPEVRIGFIPAIISVFLKRQVGEKNARDLLLTGRIIEAAEAQRLGLVTQIVSADELMAETHKLTGILLACSPTSLLKTKRLLCDFTKAELDHDLELAIQESAQIRATADFREGLASFLEKRSPRWSGK